MDTKLKSRKAEVTRDAIRTATLDLMANQHWSAVTMPAVAERAGMSVRTLYRYFPTKQALIDDVAMVYARRVDEVADGLGIYQDGQTYLPVMWAEFAKDIDAVRFQHTSSAGDAMRASRLAMAREEVGKVVQAYTSGSQASERDQVQIRELVIAMTSSAMFLELVDRQGQDPVESAKLVYWAALAIAEKFVVEGGIQS